jgi:1-acyl-sn-glycerol-3-phosphate acyltransferase
MHTAVHLVSRPAQIVTAVPQCQGARTSMTFFDLIVHAGGPLRWWVRLDVHGQDALPARGPVLVVANHDSMVDPLAVAAACHPLREVRFLAMAELWDSRVLRFLLDRLGQIPVERGGGGEAAIRQAVLALERGEAVGIFPEGGLSNGRAVRAHNGLARLVAACPDVPVVLAAVTGTDDVVRFPRRPRARVVLFAPADAGSAGHPQRLLDEVRALAPPVAAGRTGRLARHLRERRRRRRLRAQRAAR